VILAATLLPHPPLLFRPLGGVQDPVADLRAAALGAVRSATADADRVVVVGPADEARGWPADTPAGVRRFGGGREPGPSGAPLPLSLGVGSSVLRDAGWSGPVDLVSIAWDAGSDEVDRLAGVLAEGAGRTALLLLGDGSARRGVKAPGYLDERAFGFDDAVAAALAAGDAAVLAGLDAGLAAELMVLGRSTLRLLGAVALRAPGAVTGPALTYRGDPFGVSYFVATWPFEG
jgi:hypothetical protein